MPTEIKQELIDEAQTLANRSSKLQFLQANYLFLKREQRGTIMTERIIDAMLEMLEPVCPKLSKPTITLTEKK